MGDVVLFIDDDDYFRSSSSICICRICHEEEFESCKSLEAPCACSGTVKFAHRDCIQRWCNEKGNTICEICLQKFEPGYASPPKKTQLIDTSVTIRGSLEVPRQIEADQENFAEIIETDSECASAADRSAACCRLAALILTALLLIRHLFGVLTGGAGSYPLPIVTLLIVKASGILLPMYILLRIIAAIHNSIKHHHVHQRPVTDIPSSDDEDEDEEQHNI